MSELTEGIGLIELNYSSDLLDVCLKDSTPKNDPCILNGTIVKKDGNSPTFLKQPFIAKRKDNEFELTLQGGAKQSSLLVPTELKVRVNSWLNDTISLQKDLRDSFKEHKYPGTTDEINQLIDAAINFVIWDAHQVHLGQDDYYMNQHLQKMIGLVLSDHADEKMLKLKESLVPIIANLSGLSLTKEQTMRRQQLWGLVLSLPVIQAKLDSLPAVQTETKKHFQQKLLEALTYYYKNIFDLNWQSTDINWNIQMPATVASNKKSFFVGTASDRERVNGILSEWVLAFHKNFPNENPNQAIVWFKELSESLYSKRPFQENQDLNEKLNVFAHYFSESAQAQLARIWVGLASKQMSPKEAFIFSLKSIYADTKFKKDIIDIYAKHAEYEPLGRMLRKSPDGEAVQKDLMAYYQNLTGLDQLQFAQDLDTLNNKLVNAPYRNKPMMLCWNDGHLNWCYNFHYYAKTFSGRRDMGFVVEWTNSIVKSKLGTKPETATPFRPIVAGTLGGLTLLSTTGTNLFLLKYQADDWRYLTGWSVTAGFFGSFLGEMICYGSNFNPSWDKNHWFCPTLGGVLGSGITAAVLFGIFGFKSSPIPEQGTLLTPEVDKSGINYVQEYGPLKFQFEGRF